jgi:fumarate reductase (CoM/CoB) subunit B
MVKHKPTKSDLVEAENLLEETREIFGSCVRCGMCKELCPVFKILREERVSARGHGVVLSDKVLDKVLFECTLCKGCEEKCPLGIKVCDAVRKGREAMVLKGKGLKSNEEMIENIRKHGNPFGKGDVDEKGKLYCC